MGNWQDPETVISGELEDGEKLLWAGKPRQGLVLRGHDALLIPFSLMWGGFAIFWECGVIASGAPLFFRLWGIPFVLVGLYLIFGRFVVDAGRRERTVYGVTDRRVVIVSGVVSRRVKSVNLRTLNDLTLSEGRGGAGTITFGPTPPWGWWSGNALWPGAGDAAIRFELASNAREVYEIIRRAQHRS
ncbi:MAG: PH domain-containing protein [Planctomycetes bacterium]|nr:PH domain-containing protein [Planctomycetota bacterium]